MGCPGSARTAQYMLSHQVQPISTDQKPFLCQAGFRLRQSICVTSLSIPLYLIHLKKNPKSEGMRRIVELILTANFRQWSGQTEAYVSLFSYLKECGSCHERQLVRLMQTQ